MAVDAPAERPLLTRVGPTQFTAEEWAEVMAATAPEALGLRSMRTQRALKRLLAPFDEAGVSLGLSRHTVYRIEDVVLHAMQTSGLAWGNWDRDAWLAVARTLGTSCRAAVLAMGIQLGGLTGADALTVEKLEATTLARRLFGSQAVDREVERVRAYLRTVGYGVHSNYWAALTTAISRLLVRAGRADLEAMATIQGGVDRHRAILPSPAPR